MLRRVRPRPDAVALPVRLEEGVRPHAARALRVVERGVEHGRDGDVVAPALARLLVAAEAVDGGTAGEAVREPVAVLVVDDPVLEVAVPDPRAPRGLADGARRRQRRLDRGPVGLGDADGRDGRPERRRSCRPGSAASASPAGGVVLSATMTALAPAAWAFCVCCWNVQEAAGAVAAAAARRRVGTVDDRDRARRQRPYGSHPSFTVPSGGGAGRRSRGRSGR